MNSLTFPQLVERWTQIAPRVFGGELAAVESMRVIEQALMQRVDTSLPSYLWNVHPDVRRLMFEMLLDDPERAFEFNQRYTKAVAEGSLS